MKVQHLSRDRSASLHQPSRSRDLSAPCDCVRRVTTVLQSVSVSERQIAREVEIGDPPEKELIVARGRRSQ